MDAALSTLRVILEVLDFSTVKNELFPVIATVFSKTSSMGIKIRGLEAFQVLCGGAEVSEPTDDLNGWSDAQKPKKQNSVILDKYSIQEKVVPLLKAIKTKEPAVMMAALNVFNEIGKICDSDFLAVDVLPILWNFSLGPLLNLEQFQAYMTLIKSVSSKIEEDHKRKLQDLSSSNANASSRSDLVGANRTNGTNAATGNGEMDFESLVLGKKSPNTGDTFDAGWSTDTTPAAARPNTLRTQSQQRPSTETHTFSWSTPASPPPQSVPQMSRNPSLAAPLQPTSRTITPDQALSAYPVLGPSSTSSATPASSSFAQPLQPGRPGTSTSSWPSQVSPSSTGVSQPQQSTSIDWSGAIGAQSAGKWGTPMSAQASQTTAPSNGFENFSIAPPPTSPYQQFGIAPPPARGVASSGQQQQQQLGQKSGLDKYESLL